MEEVDIIVFIYLILALRLYLIHVNELSTQVCSKLASIRDLPNANSPLPTLPQCAC